MRALARTGLVLSPLMLAACDVEPMAARAVLKDRGFTHVETSAAPLLGRACDLGEPFARDFVGQYAGRRWSGTICATGEGAQDARLLSRPVQTPLWDEAIVAGRGR